MGIVIRQSIKATIISYIGFALGYISVLLLFPYFLKPEEFGLTRILIAVASITVQFAHLGMANVVVQFFPHFKEDKKKSGGLFYFSLLVSSIGFLVAAVILILFKDRILAAYQKESQLFVQYYYYVLPIAFFILIGAVIESFSRANFRIAVPALIKDVILRLLTMAIIFAFYFKLVNFAGFVNLFALIYALPVFLLLFYLKRLRLLKFNMNLSFLSKDLFRKMMSFGLFTTLVGSAAMMVNSLDVLMVSSFLGLTATAIYSVGFYIGSIIEIPTRSISMISAPIVAEAWKRNDLEKISEFYKKTSLNQTIFGSLLFIGVWANVDNLFKFLPASYAEGKWVIFFIALSKLIDMFTGINSEIITASKHYRFNFYIMLILIGVTILTNYIFIPVYGLAGAAIAAALSMLIYNIVKCFFLWVKFKMHPFSDKTIYTLLIPVIAFFISTFIPQQNNFIVDIILRSGVISILFIGLTVGLKVSEDMNHFFHTTISRIKSMFN